MKKSILILIMSVSASSFAETGWVGFGDRTSGDNPRKATVKYIQQEWTGWVKFAINESSRSLPSGRVYKFDGNSSVGKNQLAMLLTAKASGVPISFYEIENFKDEDVWKFDALHVGDF